MIVQMKAKVAREVYNKMRDLADEQKMMVEDLHSSILEFWYIHVMMEEKVMNSIHVEEIN